MHQPYFSWYFVQRLVQNSGYIDTWYPEHNKGFILLLIFVNYTEKKHSSIMQKKYNDRSALFYVPCTYRLLLQKCIFSLVLGQYKQVITCQNLVFYYPSEKLWYLFFSQFENKRLNLVF